MDTHVRVWDIRKKNTLQKLRGHGAPVSVARFTPDGRWLCSGDERGMIHIWDLTAGKLLKKFGGDQGGVRPFFFFD